MQKIGQELVDHEPRYDPTVIPTGGASNGGGGGDTDAYEHMLRHLPYSRSAAFSGNTTVGDYHAAYRAGETTPGKVAEVILRLVEKDARCKTSFVSVKREKVLAAAEASTRRFQSGEVRGLLDGVPVAIKGMQGGFQSDFQFARPQEWRGCFHFRKKVKNSLLLQFASLKARLYYRRRVHLHRSMQCRFFQA